ncbi:MAG: hypothetical protein IJE97_09125 [Thermoguttaceae bacterium]|nr:hypothetical protein [Thermoguttaceae bacterium]
MKFLSLKLAVSVCLGSLCVVGCGGPEKPDGLPELTPCRLILTQDGEPLADATARFVYQGDGDVGRWAVAGVSNDKGVVEVLTHGQFKGAPSGRYAVVVTKETTEQDGETSKVYSLIASEFTLQTTTPLTLEVGDDAVEETFDLGAPTREFLEELAAPTEP